MLHSERVKHRPLVHDEGQFHGKLTGFASLLAGLALIIQTTGCATSHTAPLIIQRPAEPAPLAKAPPGQTITLVTYNIWGLPSWMTGAPGGRYPKIARELEKLNPDFILLQEAWTAKARKAVPVNGHWSIARAAGQHTFFQQSGLVTLSRFPIVGGEFYPFSHAAFPDRFVHKGILKVTVQLPDGELLNIWNVHLQDGGALELRRSQVRELISHVAAAHDGQAADLVGGDFNCTPGSCLFDDLEQSFGSALHPCGGGAPFVTWDGLSPKPGGGRTFDHVFIRCHSPLQRFQADTRVAFTNPNLKERLSDHFGVEATVNLGAPPVLVGVDGAQLAGSSADSVVASHVLSGGSL